MLAIQGPPGHRQDAHRGADDPRPRGGREAGRRDAQSHRVIANLLESIQRAAADEGRFVRIGQRVDGEDDAGDTFGIERIPKPDAVAAGLRAGSVGRRRRHVVAVGARGARGIARRPVRGRGRAAVAGHGVRRRRRGGVGRPARRPQPAAARSRRARIPRARPRPRSSTSSARRRRSRPTAACCSGRRTASTRRSTRSSRTPSTRAGWRPTRARRSSGSRTALPVGGSGIRLRPDAHDRRLEPVARGGRLDRRRRGRAARPPLGQPEGRRPAARGRRHHHRRALQRAGRRDRAGREGADRRRRERRHRRQVPGPRGRRSRSTR